MTHTQPTRQSGPAIRPPRPEFTDAAQAVQFLEDLRGLADRIETRIREGVGRGQAQHLCWVAFEALKQLRQSAAHVNLD